MRIIAGKYKNQKIPTIKDSSYRPTTSKVREGIFSILSSGEFMDNTPVIDANILDIFSGTGSLSFESISRGAKSATLVDIDRNHLLTAQSFAKKIGEIDNFIFCQCDARNLDVPSNRSYDLVFLDPPYNKDYAKKIILKMIEKKLLSNRAIIVLEISSKKDFDNIDGLILSKVKKYNNTKLLVLKNYE